MKSILVYPLIGGAIIFSVVVILYIVFGCSKKRSLLVGLSSMILYWLLMIPNINNLWGGNNIIKSITGTTCSTTVNIIYDEYNQLNRYNPLFRLNSKVLHPLKCEYIDKCYWRTASFNQFKECVEKSS